jgi:hypothetical protein
MQWTRNIRPDHTDNEISWPDQRPEIQEGAASLMLPSRKGGMNLQFKSVKSAVTFIKELRATRGYSNNATTEWRRLSMKLSDCALIQFARRLGLRLETEKCYLIGVDEQEFDPKIHVVNDNRYSILSLSKRVDEQTCQVRYGLGHVSQEVFGHSIDVSKAPTDKDIAHAVLLIESMSLEIGVRRPAPGNKGSNKDNRKRP